MAAVEKTKKQQKKAGQAVWLSRYPYLIVIAAFTFLLYTNMFGNGYNMDDELVTMNHRLTSQGISAIPEIFTSHYYADNMGYAYDYRPVVLTTFAIEHQFFGESPLLSHLINLLIYICLCLVLYKILTRLGQPITPMLALFITLLFSAHTAHTEVVCSIKNRDEILGLLFSLAAIYFALKWQNENKWKVVLLVPLFFLLVLLSKSTYVVFALIIPLSLVLFSSLSFWVVGALTLVISVLGVLTTDIQATQYKIIFGLSINLFILGTFVFYRKISLINWFKTNFLQQENSETQHIFSQISTASVLRLFPQVVYPAAIFLILFAACHFIVSSTFLMFLFYAFVLLLGLILQKYKPGIWNLQASVLSLLLCGLVFYSKGTYPSSFDILSINFIIVMSGIMFFNGAIAYRLLAFLVLLFGFLGSWIPVHLLAEVVFLTLIFLLPQWQKGKIWNYVLGLLLLIFALTAIYDMIVVDNRIDYIPLVQLILFVIVSWREGVLFEKFKKYSTLVFLFFFLILSPALFFNDKFNLAHEIVKSKNDVSLVQTLTTTKADRTLSYIEYPLPPGTKESIRQGTALVVMGHYFQKVILPYPLSFYYGYSFIEPTEVSNEKALWSLVVHLVLLLAALYFVRTKPLISFALFIYLSTVALSSGYFMSVPGIVADRYMLVSSLGWCMLLGYGLFYLVERYLAKKTITDWSSVSTPARILALLPLVIYSSLTFSRNFHWKDHLTLMRKDVQYVTNSAQAHNLLALNIMKSTTEGQKTQAELDALRQEALGHFKQSFAIYPNTFNVAYDIGRVYSAMNNPDSMMVYFQKAADLDPDHQLPELSYTLAVYHQETKKYDYAIIQLQKLLKLQNTNLEAYSRLSYIHFTLGQYDQALATNRTAAFNLPTRPEPFINMAYTFQGMKNLDSMTYYFNLAEQRFPGHPVVLQAKRNLNNQ
jgi:tetratricopeptide (TPR) repeat protein